MLLNYLPFEFWYYHSIKSIFPNLTHGLQSHQGFSIAPLEDQSPLFIIFHPLALPSALCFFLFMLILLLCCDFFYGYHLFQSFHLQQILLSSISPLVISFASKTLPVPSKDTIQMYISNQQLSPDQCLLLFIEHVHISISL